MAGSSMCPAPSRSCMKSGRGTRKDGRLSTGSILFSSTIGSCTLCDARTLVLFAVSLSDSSDREMVLKNCCVVQRK